MSNEPISTEFLYALNGKIIFHFTRPARNGDDLHLQIRVENQGHSNDILLSYQDFFGRKMKIAELLENFIRSKSKEDLLELAALCFDTFDQIDRKLKEQTDQSFYRSIWKKQVIGNYGPMPARGSGGQGKIQHKILEAVFPDGFSFPVGMLFSWYPDPAKCENYSIPDLLQLFFDFRFRIIHTIDPLEFKEAVTTYQGPLKKNGRIAGIHAFDSRLSVMDKETGCWKVDPAISRTQVTDKKQLLETWKNPPAPQLILFSTHYDTDEIHSFNFSLGNTGFSNHDLYNIRHKIKNEERAFFFLNCCKTGSIGLYNFNTVFNHLYPEFSQGFITTEFDLRSLDAGHFPEKFFDIFIREKQYILDAFKKTKLYLMLNTEEPQYCALGYSLWLVRPDLKYEHKHITRSLNKKNKNGSKTKKPIGDRS